MLIALLFAMTLFLAYSNGANDNFKGVATLYGSNTTTFKTALIIGTLATLAGALSSLFLAEALVKAFSGKGLVPDVIAASPIFLLAVAIGAASTVMLATVLGFPISTTHALTGALAGAGFMAVGWDLNVTILGTKFFLPLLISPLACILLVMPLYKFAHFAVERLGLVKETCVCVGPGEFVPVAAFAQQGTQQGGATGGTATSFATADPIPGVSVSVGTADQCVEKYSGRLFGMTAQRLVDALHYFSAVAVSFSRGLNDTPKIVGLLLVVNAFDIRYGMLAIAIAMAVGGLLHARKVAQTMSKKITQMNDGQALTANLVTAFMVFFASKWGMPVSTTHVSVGAIAGIGIVNGKGDRKVMGSILLSWVLTLPLAGGIAALCYAVAS